MPKSSLDRMAALCGQRGFDRFHDMVLALDEYMYASETGHDFDKYRSGLSIDQSYATTLFVLLRQEISRV